MRVDGTRADVLSLGLAALATALMLLMAAPVLVAPAERIFGSEIVGRHQDPFTVMRQFAGAPVPAPFLQPATDWPGRALATVLPVVTAYNVMVLATFPLAALVAGRLTYEITQSALASVVAALGFAFSPFHVAHAAYHPHMAQVQWVALCILVLWRCLQGFTPGRAALLVAATVLATLSNFYSGFIVLALLPVLIPAIWFVRRPEGDAAGPPQPARLDLVATSLLLAGLAGFVWLATRTLVPGLAERAPHLVAERSDLFTHGARWWAHLVPPVDHPLLGRLAEAIWQRHDVGPALLEQQVYLGMGVLMLAAVAVAAWWTHRRQGQTLLHAVPALALIAGAALVYSLSPEREVFGWRTLRPSALLYEVAPMFRAYARFAVVTQLMAVMLAGIGVQWLWSSRRPTARLAVVGLLALTVFEYAPWRGRARDVLPSAAHRWLAAQPSDVRLFDCAPASAADQLNGWLAGFVVTHADAATTDCRAPQLAATLRVAGHTHVVVRPTDDAWPARTAARTPTPYGLREAYRADDGVVLEVAGAMPPAAVTAWRGWYRREYDHERSWRWAPGPAGLTLQNAGSSAATVDLDLELASFHAPRRVDVVLNGAPVAEIAVDTHRQSYVLERLELRQGRNELALVPRDPPVAPRAVLPAHADTRPLSIALGEWSLTERSATRMARF